jgi:transposase
VKVALEAMKGQETINEVSSEYGVHPTQITQWKKQVLDELPTIFARPGSEQVKSDEALIASLYQQIGQLKGEVDFLKKIRPVPLSKNSSGLILIIRNCHQRFSIPIKESSSRATISPTASSSPISASVGMDVDEHEITCL